MPRHKWSQCEGAKQVVVDKKIWSTLWASRAKPEWLIDLRDWKCLWVCGWHVCADISVRAHWLYLVESSNKRYYNWFPQYFCVVLLVTSCTVWILLVLYNEPLQSIASTVIITNALQLTQTDRNHKTSISWNIQAGNLKWSVNDNVFVMMAVYPQCVIVNMMVGCEYAYEN